MLISQAPPQAGKPCSVDLIWSPGEYCVLDDLLPLETQSHLERLTGCKIIRDQLLQVVHIRGSSEEACSQVYKKFDSDVAAYVCPPRISSKLVINVL
jgi:hypothetical protein